MELEVWISEICEDNDNWRGVAVITVESTHSKSPQLRISEDKGGD